jgi:5'-AMP-activated protein kinase regulatory gamma subunit
LKDLEKALGVDPIETVSIDPLQPLYKACLGMIRSRARRIPLIDIDHETRRAQVVSVVTQYRILKFVAINVTETQQMCMSLGELGLGTYQNLATVTMDTPVIDVIHLLVKHNIASVPILDENGKLNLLLVVWIQYVDSCLFLFGRVRDKCVRGSRRHLAD